MNKDQLAVYLNQFGLTEVLQGRIDSIQEFYATFLPWKIEDVFISEYLKENGERVFEGLWLFGGGYAMEAHNFASPDDSFDVAPLIVGYLLVKKTAYDYKTATAQSRLSVHANSLFETTFDLKASGGNCDQLREIIRKWLVPHLSKPAFTEG